MYIKTEDPDLPAFYYDPLIHPIPSYQTGRGAHAAKLATLGVADFEDEDEFVLPDDVAPLLQDVPLYVDSTASGALGRPSGFPFTVLLTFCAFPCTQQYSACTLMTCAVGTFVL